MTLYYFYRIIHPNYPLLNYVGSTKDIKKRKREHKSNCFNEKSNRYNSALYTFIRNNNINWDELKFEILLECNTDIHLKLENMFIQQYNSIELGLNKWNSFNPNTKKDYVKNNKEKIMEYRKEYKTTSKYKEYENNYNRQKIQCPICQFELNRSSLSRHKKAKH